MAEEAAIGRLTLWIGGFVAAGVLLIVCGVLVQVQPVAITVGALAIYVVYAAAWAYLDRNALATLSTALIFRIIVIAGLANAVQCALAYEREGRVGAIKAEVASPHRQ